MKGKQGILHLLSILFIPGLLVSAFLVQNFYLTIALTITLLVLVWIIFFKGTN